MQSLTANESTLLENLLEQVENYIQDQPLTGKVVDNGFYYDYGSITGAWHSSPELELDEDWGELELDVEHVEDYILDHLVESVNGEYKTISCQVSRRGYEDSTEEINTSWYWCRVKEKTFLVFF